MEEEQKARCWLYPKPSPREYVSGASWLYQGRQYRLELIEKDGTSKVALRRPVLAVETLDKQDRVVVKTASDKWYRGRVSIPV